MCTKMHYSQYLLVDVGGAISASTHDICVINITFLDASIA